MMSHIDRTTNTLVGGPEPVGYDDGTASFGQLCLKRLTEHGDYVILIDALTDEHITAVQLRDRAIRVACALLASGLRSGDCVSVCSANRAEFAYVLFGAVLAGVTLAPLNVTYTEGELHHAFQLSKPHLIFTDSASYAKVNAVAGRNQFVRKVIQFGRAFEDFAVNDRTKSETFSSAGQSIDDCIAVILCSSGTTGMPKGVQLTQRNVMVGLHQHMVRPQRLEQQAAPEPITLGIIPWFHAFGCMCLMAQTLYRVRMVFMPRFEETGFLEAIPKYRINTLYLVPPLMVFLAKHPLVAAYDLSTVAIIWCGAAPLSAELEQSVRRRLSAGTIIRQGYGMTEATFALSGQTDDAHHSGSVGRLRHGLLARIVDEETGRALPANRTGELWFKGSVVMKGYVGDRRATDSTVDADGWLHSGDIGYYSDTGELFVVDRLKELIKYNGFQVPPAELEGLLLEHGDVMDAGVIGVPNERTGELPMAFVVRREGSRLGAEEVQRFVAERMSPAKRLHGGVRFVDTIPKSPSGKILRRELRDMLKKQQVVPSKL